MSSKYNLGYMSNVWCRTCFFGGRCMERASSFHGQLSPRFRNGKSRHRREGARGGWLPQGSHCWLRWETFRPSWIGDKGISSHYKHSSITVISICQSPGINQPMIGAWTVWSLHYWYYVTVVSVRNLRMFRHVAGHLYCARLDRRRCCMNDVHVGVDLNSWA